MIIDFHVHVLPPGDMPAFTSTQFHRNIGAIAIARAYRKRIQQIRAATDERTFYSHRSLRFERLQGVRAGQYAMRLNDQWRLIVELRGAAPRKTVYVVEIVDYH
jgi:toxin HigB-1